MRYFIFLTIFLSLFINSFGAKSTVMLQLSGKNVKISEDVILVVRMGVEEILTENGYILISEADQKEVLKEQVKQRKSGCYDNTCLVDVGKMLAAQAVFSVEIVKLGKRYIFKLRYLDMESGAVLKTKSLVYKGKLENADILLPFSKKITKEIFNKKGNIVKKIVVENDNKDIKKEKKIEKLPTTAKGECKDGVCNIPAGEFLMGCSGKNDKYCERDEKPQHKVYLDSYNIDQYEVTVDQYKKCVDAKKCSKKNYQKYATYNNYKKCNYGSDRGENQPMNCVNWFGAEEYCKWKGKRLPTEAEWEKAARGINGDIYPWKGSSISCDNAVMNDNGKGCRKYSTWSVGSKKNGVSPYGLFDMSGNVAEWVYDKYGKYYYKKSPKKNPKGSNSGSSRVLKGGDWSLTGYALRSSNRTKSSPYEKKIYYGFRCAKGE